MSTLDFSQLLGNYGEFVGAIAIVVTLIYLAGQLRQNTKALRSSIYTSYVEHGNSWCQLAGQHAAELAAIGHLSPSDEMSEEQEILWMTSVFSTFNQWEEVFLHYRTGSLDQDVYEAKVRAFRKYIDWSPWHGRLRQAWEANKEGYTEEFQRFMANEICT